MKVQSELGSRSKQFKPWTIKMNKNRIDSFLYHFQLETGGIFFGWLGIYGSLILIFFMAFMLVAISETLITNEQLEQLGLWKSEGMDDDAFNNIRKGF